MFVRPQIYSTGRSNNGKSILTGNIGNGTGTLLVGDTRLSLLIRSDKRLLKRNVVKCIAQVAAMVGSQFQQVI